jgi:hypothetical protein
MLAVIAAPAGPAFALSLITSVSFPNTVIDFSSIGNTVPITNQYYADGVTFSGALIGLTNFGDTDLFPRSPAAVASNWDYGIGNTFVDLSFTATFLSPITELDFYEELNPEDQVTVTAYDGLTDLGSLTLPSPTDIHTGLPFYGVQSAPFDRAVFTISDNFNGFFAMNDFTFSSTTVAPELSIWAMRLTGFAGLGFVGLRRAKGRVAIENAA